MKNKLRLKQTLQKVLDTKQGYPEDIPGKLGATIDGEDRIRVPDRDSFVYVRIRGKTSEIAQAFNDQVNLVFDLPVILRRDKESRIYRVVSRDLGQYDEWGGSNGFAQLAPHGAQHSFGGGYGSGTDVVWVYKRQFMPLLLHPYAGMTVKVEDEWYLWEEDYNHFAGATIDLTGGKPLLTDQGRFITVYLAGATNTLAGVTGTLFNITPFPTDIDNYVPLVNSNIGIPVGAVLLTHNTTTIAWTDLYDIRPLFTGKSVQGYVSIFDDNIWKTTGTAIVFQDGLVVHVTGSFAYVDWTGSAGSNLPADAVGYLYNDGAGALSWEACTSSTGSSLGTHIFVASQNGAVLDSNLYTGGGTDDTAALQTILNHATGSYPIMLIMDGAALVSGLNVYGNTTIYCLDEAGFYLNSGSNQAILRNANRSRTTIIDERISIIGGYYNGNKDGQVGSGITGHQEADNTFMSGIQMFGVNYLTFRDVTVAGTMAFGINIGNGSYLTVNNYTYDAGNTVHDNNQDGFHINGAWNKAYLSDLKIYSYDDALAINAGDDTSLDLTDPGDPNYNIQGSYVGQGAITDLIVHGLEFTNCLSGIRLLSHDDNSRIDRIHIQDVKGTYKDQAVLVSTGGIGTGSFGRVVFESFNVAETTPTSIEPCLMQFDATFETLVLKDIEVHSASDDRPLIWFRPTAIYDEVVIDGFRIYDRNSNSVGMIPIKLDGYIRRLSVSNVDWFRYSIGQAPSLISMTNASSSIDAMVLNGITVNSVNYIVYRTAGGGTFPYLQACNIRHEGDGGNASFYVAGVTVTRLDVSNWYGSSVFNGTATNKSGDAFGEKVSSNDTTAGFLKTKLVEGAGISLTEVGDGGNETLRISYTGTTASGGGGNTLLIYDDNVFKVTGTAIAFQDGLIVKVTGSVAYVDWTGTYGHVVQDDGVAQSQRANLNFVGAGFAVYDNAGGNATIVSGTASGGGTTLPADAVGYLYNDGAGVLSWAGATGTATYMLAGIPSNLSGNYFQVPSQLYATGSLAIFLNGVSQRLDTDYSFQFPSSGTYQLLATPPTGSFHFAIWGVPKGYGEGGGSGDIATDSIWDAKGDLAVGTGADTAIRLPVGNDGEGLECASGEATGLIWSPLVPSNFLINGGFDFAHRQTPTTSTTIATDKYSADRWRVSRETGTFQYRMYDATGETGLTSYNYGFYNQLTGTSKFMIYQIVEGINSVPFRSKKIVFQAKIKASSSKTIRMAIIELQNAGTVDTIPTTFVTAWGADTTDPTLGSNLAIITGAESKSVTTSWTNFSVSITVPSNSKNIICAIWSDSRFSAGDTISIAEAGLYVGSKPKLWIPRLIQQELSLCQRYCWRSDPNVTAGSFGMGQCFSTTQCEILAIHPVLMRAVPTVSGSGTFKVWAANAAQLTVTSVMGADATYSNARISQLYCTVASGLVAGNATVLLASATTNYILFEAEL